MRPWATCRRGPCSRARHETADRRRRLLHPRLLQRVQPPHASRRVTDDNTCIRPAEFEAADYRQNDTALEPVLQLVHPVTESAAVHEVGTHDLSRSTLAEHCDGLTPAVSARCAADAAGRVLVGPVLLACPAVRVSDQAERGSASLGCPGLGRRGSVRPRRRVRSTGWRVGRRGLIQRRRGVGRGRVRMQVNEVRSCRAGSGRSTPGRGGLPDRVGRSPRALRERLRRPRGRRAPCGSGGCPFRWRSPRFAIPRPAAYGPNRYPERDGSWPLARALIGRVGVRETGARVERTLVRRRSC